jgi:hypothetical protein
MSDTYTTIEAIQHELKRLFIGRTYVSSLDLKSEELSLLLPRAYKHILVYKTSPPRKSLDPHYIWEQDILAKINDDSNFYYKLDFKCMYYWNKQDEIKPEYSITEILDQEFSRLFYERDFILKAPISFTKLLMSAETQKLLRFVSMNMTAPPKKSTDSRYSWQQDVNVKLLNLGETENQSMDIPIQVAYSWKGANSYKNI